ncbi:MAG: hypothetical protein HY536_02290 [Candidatus Colwellbacteria bacterium]|nr:hypothetical protein [Candidatus Colwellbacteria bacterium]
MFIQEIRIVNGGTGSVFDLENFRLTVDEWGGKIISFADRSSWNTATLTFSPPLVVLRNQWRTVTVVADVANDASGTSFQFLIETATDVLATNIEMGERVPVSHENNLTGDVRRGFPLGDIYGLNMTQVAPQMRPDRVQITTHPDSPTNWSPLGRMDQVVGIFEVTGPLRRGQLLKLTRGGNMGSRVSVKNIPRVYVWSPRDGGVSRTPVGSGSNWTGTAAGSTSIVQFDEAIEAGEKLAIVVDTSSAAPGDTFQVALEDIPGPVLTTLWNKIESIILRANSPVLWAIADGGSMGVGIKAPALPANGQMFAASGDVWLIASLLGIHPVGFDRQYETVLIPLRPTLEKLGATIVWSEGGWVEVYCAKPNRPLSPSPPLRLPTRGGEV